MTNQQLPMKFTYISDIGAWQECTSKKLYVPALARWEGLMPEGYHEIGVYITVRGRELSEVVKNPPFNEGDIVTHSSWRCPTTIWFAEKV